MAPPSASPTPSVIASEEPPEPLLEQTPSSASAPQASTSIASTLEDVPEKDTYKIQLQEAIHILQEREKKDVMLCRNSYKTALQLWKDHPNLSSGTERERLNLHRLGANCAAYLGDCRLAWEIYLDGYPIESLANVREEPQHTTYLRMSFGSEVPKCKGKAPAR